MIAYVKWERHPALRNWFLVITHISLLGSVQEVH